MQSRGFVGRSEFVPNENFEPMVPATTAGFNLPEAVALGETPNGQAWAIKALHPNIETVTSSAGIPDHISVPVVTPEFRVNHTITGRGSGVDGLDDVDIIVTGCEDLAFFYRRYPANTIPPNDEWTPVYFPGSGPQIRQVLAYPTTAGDTKTIPLWAGVMALYMAKARGMYFGFTLDMDAPMTKDEGIIAAGQVALTETANITRSEVSVWDGNNPVTYSQQDMSSVSFGRLPLSQDDLFQASPGTVVHEAREGIYLPLRFREPVHLFTEVQNAIPTQQSRDGLVPSVLTYFRPDDNKYVSFRGNDPRNTTSKEINIATECPFNFLTGIVLLRGVSAAANFNAKARVGVQGLVTIPSALSSFQHEAPLLDQRAIDMVTKFSQQMPMAFPAYYNDTNAMSALMKAMLPHIASVLSALGIPGAGLVGSVISGFLGGPTKRAARKMRNEEAGVATMLSALKARARRG